MEELVRKNPWLGLESYKEGEILYGRDDDIRNLSQCVLNDTDTLLHGKSGIGKSSILNAGILPAARRKGYLPILIRLSHKEKHSYLYQINQAIFNAILHSSTSELGTAVSITNGDNLLNDSQSLIREVVSCKDTETESFYEYFHRHTFHNVNGERLKLLIIFDQFEEIFTLQDDVQKKKNFFTHLADLLNDIMPDELQQKVEISSDTQEDIIVERDVNFENIFDDLNLDVENSLTEYVTDNDIHFVFTIREDFLSEFEYYSATIPSLKQNRYGLRPINKEQAEEIICKPCKGLVDNEVAKLIIKKVTELEDSEQNEGKAKIEVDEVDVAFLSLFLKRLYEKKPETEQQITSDLVNNYSGDIILDFYKESTESNEENNEVISKKSIHTLEDLLLTYDGHRNNVSRSDLEAKGITQEELSILIDKRKLLRQFKNGTDTRIEYIHDRICEVVKKLKEQRESLLKQERERQEQEKRIEDEKNKRRKIQEEAAKEKERLEKEARHIKQRIHERTIFAIFFIIVISLFVSNEWFKDYTEKERYYNENEKLYEEYYAKFENRNGWPTGIGKPLTEEERKRTPLYYRLSHKGNKNGDKHTDVKIMSSTKFLPESCRLEKLEWAEEGNNDTRAKEYNDILKKVTDLKFYSNAGNNKISREELIDKDGNILMTINYFHISENDAWLQFYTTKGKNMQIRDNGLDRMKLSWDSIGRIRYLMYYNNIIQPKDIAKNVKGYIWEYKNDTTYRYALNEVGRPTFDLKNNTMVTIEKEGKVVELKYLKSRKFEDKSNEEVECEDGYSRIIFINDSIKVFTPGSETPYATRYTEKNEWGQIIRVTTNVTEGTKSNFVPKIEYEYENGLVKKKESLDKDGTPYGKTDETIYKHEFTYNETGDIIEEKRTNKAGILSYHHKIDTIRTNKDTTIISIVNLDITKTPEYSKQVDSITPTYTSTTYYERNNTKQNKPINVGKNELSVHKKIVTQKYDTISKITTITQEFYYWDKNIGKIIPLQNNPDKSSVKSYFKRIEERDNDGNLTSLRLENADGTIIKNMMYFIHKGQMIGRAVKGIDGDAVRCDNWEEENFLYYKLYLKKDDYENYSGIITVDEFENISPLFNKAYGYLHSNTLSAELIANGETLFTYNYIKLTSDNTLSDLEIPYIHVLSKDSKMYDNKDGVIDGDRIIEFEGWSLGRPINSFKKEWKNSVGKNKKIKITILRPNKNENNDYDIKKLELYSDSIEDKYIEYHLSKVTKEEKKFYQKYKK